MLTLHARCGRTVLALALIAVTRLGCGGGGGGGGSSGGGSVVVPTPAPEFPVLVTSSAFSLAPIADPAERTALAGHQLGRVLLSSGLPAPAGIKVEWLDAAVPATPRVLAAASTDANGAFDIAGASNVAAADQWLRATLSDGTVLRAFAGGWTELSVGTEVAVSEIARLRRAGALAARVWPMDELAIGQQSLSLLGQARFRGLPAPAAVQGLTAFVAQFLPWNQYLDRLASATPDAGPGDVAALLPFERNDAPVPATVKDASGSGTVAANTSCFVTSIPKWRECGVSVANHLDVSEQLSVRPGGILLHNLGGTDGLDKLLYQIGDLPLIEFAPVIGTRVIYNNAKVVQEGDPAIHAAIKVTRRTYPMAMVAALGGNVTAIEVVLDYEVAILNTTTKQQADLLVRERRWFSPLGGRVHFATEGLARSGTTITTVAAALTLDGAPFETAAAFPMMGVADAAAVPMAHLHAVYAPGVNRIYVATEDKGGQILELDPTTLTTLRGVPTSGVPTRLATSSDGLRIYAALAGGSVLELRSADLGEVRRFPVAALAVGEIAFDTVSELAVDPFNPERLLTVIKSSRSTENGGALLFNGGRLESTVAPRYYVDAVGWSSVRDEFFGGSIGSPQSVMRFRASAPAVTELASLLRVADIGVREAGGQLLTPTGTIIDAASLVPLGKLSIQGRNLNSCIRLDARSDVCEVAGNTANGVDASYIRFDNASGAFLG
ncbi:MAG TPA: hypothetical protein VFU95_04580, partial [Telluria sp.]|nr:hypothetical protein [Telluria sp.]